MGGCWWPSCILAILERGLVGCGWCARSVGGSKKGKEKQRERPGVMLPVARLGDLRLLAGLSQNAAVAVVKQSLAALDSGAPTDDSRE